MPRREALFNVILLGASCLVTLAVCEFIVFKYLLKTNDNLEFISANNVVRYFPGARAIFYSPGDKPYTVTINADGWNSTKPRYELAKPKDRLRIAVVGDSYVYGTGIDTVDGFPEVLEKRLVDSGVSNEVYRFGIGGAPLSQYYYMLREDVTRYRPDVVVVQLIHNDFDESSRFLHGNLGRCFLRIFPDERGKMIESSPISCTQETFFRPLTRLRTFRHLYYQTGLAALLRDAFSSPRTENGVEPVPKEVPAAGFYSSGVDIRFLHDPPKLRAVASYIMKKMQTLAMQNDFKIVFVMDAVREAIYAGKGREHYRVAVLSEMAREISDELGLPFLDLQTAFARHYRDHHRRFEFRHDWHWNALGHRVVGEALAQFLLDSDKLDLLKPRNR